MSDDKYDQTNKPTQQMTDRDIIVELVGLVSQEGVSSKKLSRILDYVEKVVSEPN